MNNVIVELFEFFGIGNLSTVVTVGELFVILIKIAVAGGLFVFFCKGIFYMAGGKFKL